MVGFKIKAICLLIIITAENLYAPLWGLLGKSDQKIKETESSYVQPYGEQSYTEPYGEQSYTESSYVQPYGEQSYTEPSYGEQSYTEPSYGEQSYTEPYGEPSYGEQSYTEPYGEPSYGAEDDQYSTQTENDISFGGNFYATFEELETLVKSDKTEKNQMAHQKCEDLLEQNGFDPNKNMGAKNVKFAFMYLSIKQINELHSSYHLHGVEKYEKLLMQELMMDYFNVLLPDMNLDEVDHGINFNSLKTPAVWCTYIIEINHFKKNIVYKCMDYIGYLGINTNEANISKKKIIKKLYENWSHYIITIQRVRGFSTEGVDTEIVRQTQMRISTFSLGYFEHFEEEVLKIKETNITYRSVHKFCQNEGLQIVKKYDKKIRKILERRQNKK